jgi:uncharacterized repeat protein (TIGR03803 family)
MRDAIGAGRIGCTLQVFSGFALVMTVAGTLRRREGSSVASPEQSSPAPNDRRLRRSRQVRIWSFCRAALGICATAILAGCGGSQTQIVAPNAIPFSNAMAPSSYQVLHSFTGSPDGGHAEAGLINVKGALYGTTAQGGKFNRQRSDLGEGTVFSISTTGTEHVLHSFGRHNGGSRPYGSLIDVNGTLYGTTYLGGAKRSGTVFSTSTTGKEHVLYSFSGGSDGGYPYASLINVRGTLYGSTSAGGASNYGTVFSIATTGTEKILHRFASGSDGRTPVASLIDVNGTLYGTTLWGGGSGCAYAGGCGTVYSISTSGTEKVLHSFGGALDGSQPYGKLIDVNGTLYGTTFYGGAFTGGPYGSGTVFSITTSGTEKVLHSFGGSGTDGDGPAAGLIDVNETLYGTTNLGGAYDCGTVFSITTGGTEKILYSFGSGTDGCRPGASSLISVGGTLYGTTASGGTFDQGTVFALTP